VKENAPFIKTIRSGICETIHRISVVAVKGNHVIYHRGNPDIVVPIRSTAKPFILTPLINAAKDNGINLTDAQISVMASSHNGEKAHRECVNSILNLSGSFPSDLKCGTHLPFYAWLYDDYFNCSDIAIRQLFHNCSGKHAGMLLLSKLWGLSTDNYWHIEHPLQKAITTSAKEHLHISDDDCFNVGVDGCGSPTYAITVRKLAEAYQRLLTSNSLKKVYNAMLAEPFMIAGTDRVDTLITTELGFIAKSGADGLFCVSCPDQDIGIALKIESGDDDAAESAIIEVLDQLNLLQSKNKKTFEPYRFLQIFATNGELVGNYSPIEGI